MKRFTALVFVVAVLAWASTASAATRYSVVGGDWNSTVTWSATSGGPNGASVPVAGDNVYIEGGHNVAITDDAACATLDIAPGTALQWSSSSKTLTVSSTFTNGGTITMTLTSDAINGTLDNTGTVDISGDGATITALINDVGGRVVISSTSYTITTFTTTAIGNTVVYNALGPQSLYAQEYFDLTLGGSFTKSIAGGTSVDGTMSISGSIANIATGVVVSVGSLTLGGENKVAGTWGSTSSSATNTDDSYFAATTGMLNVSTELAVELTSFAATAVKQSEAQLSWTTASEVHNYGFDIERKHTTLAANSPWQNIAFLPGGGTSNSPRNYSYVDVGLAPGRYAYRIKQINTDGSFEYHSAVEVMIGSVPKVLALSPNYPNPFNPSTTIEFTVPEDGHVTMKIYSIIGQEVATLFNGNAHAGVIQKVTFDASSLASGMYVSRLQYGNKTLLHKMMLMK
jgi:hypothetical protein